MAIAIEAFTVVVRIASLEVLGGRTGFHELVPNGTFCYDDDLCRCAFMDRSDAVHFIDGLVLQGLSTSDAQNPDVVLVNGFRHSMTPQCDWLNIAAYKQGCIGWLEGSEPRTISAPNGWDPESEMQLEQLSDDEAAQRLKFLRREENVEVFLDTQSGREVFVGRAGLPLDQMYEEAKLCVLEHLRDPGTPRLVPESDSELRRAIEMLQIFSERRPENWTCHWLLGKAWHALDDSQRAYTALSRAFQLEKGDVVVRELAGICLELGKTAEAIELAEATVAEDPTNGDLLGNLTLAYLLDGRLREAETTAQSALRLAPDDKVNQAVAELVQQVISGKKPQPCKLSDLN